MPSGKQILLSLISEISQRKSTGLEAPSITEQLRASLLLHGSTAADRWHEVADVEWSTEGDSRQGLALKKSGILLTDLFEEMVDGPIPESVRRAFPALTEEEYSSATSVMWMLLSALQFFDELESVESGGNLDLEERDRMIGSYTEKLKNFYADPNEFAGERSR
ncbi:hypothetical protein AAFN60_21225 [Roseibacillus persicicus]|uniref:hypothetical protein n=1 Tax=Roseibacillus persicicus TaxID=454148 RepID=UPI00398AC6CF